MLKMTNPKNDRKYKVEFLVVEDPKSARILGRNAVEQMALVKLQYENIMMLQDKPGPLQLTDLEREFGEVFEGTGCFEETYQIHTDQV